MSGVLAAASRKVPVVSWSPTLTRSPFAKTLERGDKSNITITRKCTVRNEMVMILETMIEVKFLFRFRICAFIILWESI